MIRLLHRFGQGSASRLRNLAYRLLGVDFRDYCWLRAVEIPRQWEDITLHGCSLDRGVVLLCSGAPRKNKIEVGHGAYVNRYTIIDAHEHIGIDGEHGMRPDMSVKSQPMRSRPVIIEDEAWLGAHVVVLPGVRIGRGAVIGAGSVVTRDIPAGTVAHGSPARPRRSRSETE
jgi:acetyltransferase-like isoleucine patch superfamily enzyme